MPTWRNSRLHAEGARLVRHNRHDQLADLLVARASSPASATNAIVVEALRPSLPLWNSEKSSGRLSVLSGSTWTLRGRHEAAELLAPLEQIADLRTVFRRAVERRLRDFVVGDRNAEPGAERPELVFVELLLLVGDVLAFTRFADAVALDRAGQDHGRLPRVLDGGLVGRVDLHRIVAAERQLLQLLVGQVLDHLEQPRILAPEVLPDVGARLDGVFLVLAVDDLAHALDEQAVVVLVEQRIPLAAPDAP